VGRCAPSTGAACIVVEGIDHAPSAVWSLALDHGALLAKLDVASQRPGRLVHVQMDLFRQHELAAQYELLFINRYYEGVSVAPDITHGVDGNAAPDAADGNASRRRFADQGVHTVRGFDTHSEGARAL
jgi:hypothetical protein